VRLVELAYVAPFFWCLFSSLLASSSSFSAINPFKVSLMARMKASHLRSALVDLWSYIYTREKKTTSCSLFTLHTHLV
jgi:hypothetical protein